MEDLWNNRNGLSGLTGDQSARPDDGSPQRSDLEAMLNRLQRNGGALNACECGSRNWLPPNGIYQLVLTGAAQAAPAKSVIPVTCAACGFTKLYDPAVVASIAETSGRW